MIPLALAILTVLSPTAGIKLTAEVVGDNPLPFQAVRLRVTVENAGSVPATRLRYPERAIRISGVKRAGEREFHPIKMFPLIHRENIRICGEQPNLDEPLTLGPGERCQVSFPIAMEEDPVFTKPGTYVLRCEYLYGALTAEVRVEVAKPAESDQVWIDTLTPSLAQTLLDPTRVCSAEQSRVLRELMKKAPRSTFVNYARFAIARYHTRSGIGFSHRENHTIATGELLAALDSTIASDGFPFCPHLLLELWLEAPEKRKDLEATLNRNHRDAGEWVWSVAATLGPSGWKLVRKPGALTPEEWTQIRRSKPLTLEIPGLDPSEFSPPP